MTSDLYRNNADFKRYVDAYATTHKISVENALKHALVVSVAKFYKEDNEK